MHFVRDLIPLFLAALAVAAVVPATASASPQATEQAKRFLAAHEARLRPLDIAAALAWWNANISGKDEDFKKKEEAQNRIDEALSDKDRFAELKQIKQLRDKGEVEDKVLARGVDVLYLMYLEKQVDPALLKRSEERRVGKESRPEGARDR